MSLLTIIFVMIVTTGVALRLWLGARNMTCVRDQRGEVPERFRDTLALDAHQMAADYTIARERLAEANMLLAASMCLIWTLGGGIEAIDATLSRIVPTPIIASISVVVAVVAFTALIQLPVSAYTRLVVDRRFGLARAGIGLMASDLAKKALLGLVVLVPGAAAILWLIQAGRADWWIWAWFLWTGATLAKHLVHSMLVAPLFNRYTPLSDPSLVDRLEALAARVGHAFADVRVVDASRRTGHGNASFSGLGRAKRIVLSDTLMGTLNPTEIEAVVAHEMGHFRRRHVQVYLTAVAAARFLGLGTLASLTSMPGFNAALGVSTTTSHATLLLIGILMAACSPFIRPFEATLLRHFEFEADQFAVRYSAPGALAEALVKLCRNNATSVTEDRLFSICHQGHPPITTRLARIPPPRPSIHTQSATAA